MISDLLLRSLYVYISTLQGAYSQIEVLIWGKTKTGLTCKSTPLAPLVTCFSFTRMHLSAEKICWVTQSVFWVNSHVSCWAHLGMFSMARLWRVLGFQSVSLSQRALISSDSTLSLQDPQSQCTKEPIPSLNVFKLALY